MKYIKLLLLLISASSFAGGYSNPDIDTYDSETGIYYKAYVETGDGFLSKISGTRISNVYIFDPNRNKGSLLLPQDRNRMISFFTFETSFEEGVIQFANRSGYRVQNNAGIKRRDLKNKILYGLWNEKLEQVTLFTCTKNGSEISKLATVPKGASFHIDVRNDKVRVVEQVEGTVSIGSYEW